MDNDPDDPLTGGDPSLDLTGGWDDPPGGATGGRGEDRQGGGKQATIGGGRWGLSILDGQDNAGDATSLAPPLLSLLLSAIAEKHVAGGVPLSANTDLNAVPADKDDIVNVDGDGTMVAAVIDTPDTTGGDDAREAIVFALSSSTRRKFKLKLLVIHNFFSSLNDVDL